MALTPILHLETVRAAGLQSESEGLFLSGTIRFSNFFKHVKRYSHSSLLKTFFAFNETTTSGTPLDTGVDDI